MTAAWGAAVRPARTPGRPASNAWPLAIQPHGPAPSEDITLWADSRGRATGAPGTAVVWRLGGRSLGGDPALCGHHHTPPPDSSGPRGNPGGGKGTASVSRAPPDQLPVLPGLLTLPSLPPRATPEALRGTGSLVPSLVSRPGRGALRGEAKDGATNTYPELSRSPGRPLCPGCARDSPLCLHDEGVGLRPGLRTWFPRTKHCHGPAPWRTAASPLPLETRHCPHSHGHRVRAGLCLTVPRHPRASLLLNSPGLPRARTGHTRHTRREATDDARVVRTRSPAQPRGGGRRLP